MLHANDLSAFTFTFSGYGHYVVTYTTPSGRYMYRVTIDDMTIIDDTKNADWAKLEDIEHLRYLCIHRGTKTRIY